MSSRTHITEMQDALSANIEYLKENGTSQLIIRHGELEYEVGENFVYKFETSSKAKLDADAEVEVFVRRENTSGKIVSFEGSVVRVELERNLGTHISEARLVISSYYLLERLKERIASRDSKSQFGDKVFGLIDQNVTDSFTNNNHEGVDLNDYQEQALNSSLANEVTYIWGPPGTGKTKTIASILEAFNNNGLSALVLSHTNIATDEVLYKASKHLHEISNEDFLDGRVIRIGKIQHSSLEKEYANYVVPEAIIERKTASIRKEIAGHETKIAKIRKQITPIEEKLSDIEAFTKLVSKIRSKQKFLDQQKATFNESRSQIRHKEKELAQLEAEYSEFQNKGALSKFFSARKEEYYSNRRTKLQQEKRLLFDKTSNIREVAEKELLLLKSLESEAEKLDINASNVDPEPLRAKVSDLNSQIANHQNEIDDLKREIAELTKKVIKDASIVATTLTKSYMNEEVLDREYDCVIIDEISMAPLPAVWFATSLAKKRVVVVGDFFQLPPVVKHQVLKKKKSSEDVEYEASVIDKWLRKDVFETAGITKAIKSDTNLPVSTLCQLKEQYRMEKPIAELVNVLVYSKYSGGKYSLETGDIEKNRPDPINKEPLKGFRVGVFDTSEQKPYVSSTDSRSKYSILNALLDVSLAEKFIKAGYEKVGIVSAYRAQANLLQTMLKDKELSSKVEADTVHRFQGGEKSVIILDITTPYTPSMYDDGKEEGDDEKLLNVALSRAQDRCVIVGDVKNIESRHSSSSLIRKLLQHCRKNKYPFVSTKNLIDEYTSNKQTEEWLKKLKNVSNPQDSTIFDEKDFYQNFHSDLFDAKNEIVIVSPYISEYRSEQLIPVLVNAQRQGVQVFVQTRHPSKHSGQMRSHSQAAIEKLEEHGVTVLPFKKNIHQKIAIIDRKILWEGSLNILSQRDSGEAMRRFPGDGIAAKQILKYLRFDKNIGKMGENELERCEYCEEAGSWYWNDVGRFGEWTFCLQRSHKKGDPPKTEREVKQKKEKIQNLRKAKKEYRNGKPVCPEHDEEMILKPGRFGEFWGCPEYPRLGCKITEKVK